MAQREFLKKLLPNRSSKSRRKGIYTGSLARRVLLISFFLLVLPLLIHTIILYFSDYQLHSSDFSSFLRTYSESLFSLIFFIGLLGGGAVYLLTKRMAYPLEALQSVMERVSQGEVEARFRRDPLGFEINQLGNQFNEMLDNLLRLNKEAEREKLARERLDQELKIGREIQMSLLPSSLPQFPGIEVASTFIPAVEVSGDFYDLFSIDAHRCLIVIADSAGKGVSACLYGLGFRSALRSFASMGIPVEEIIKRTQDLFLLDTADSGFFITAWIGIYDNRTRQLHYSSQGHPPALLLRGNELEELATGGLPFGVEEGRGANVKELYIHKKDLLFFCTDGVIEAHDRENQLFGMKRLKEEVSRLGEKGPRRLGELLLREIQTFSHGKAPHDDITFFSILFSD